MALSVDSTGPVATDISITGEQSTSGLARAAVTMAHTTGQNTWTFANTFTYTGNTAVGINKVVLWDAPSGGNLITEDVISLTTFSVNGDNAPFVISFSL